MTIAGKIIQSILGFLHIIKKEADDVLHWSNQAVNVIMAFEQTPTGQMILGALKGLVPANWWDAVSLALPPIFKTLKWATTNIENATEDEILAEGWNYLKSLEGSAKAVQLSAFNSLIGEIINGDVGAGLSIQHLISLNQAAHNPDIFSAAA